MLIGPSFFDETKNFIKIFFPYAFIPGVRRPHVFLHARLKKAKISCGYISQGMSPILKNRLIATLCFVQMGLVIIGNTRVKNMMVTAFDDTDRVDLNISQMLDDLFGGDAAFAKSTLFMKALCVYPTAPGLSTSHFLNRFHPEITIDEKLKKRKVVRRAWKSAARKMTTAFFTKFRQPHSSISDDILF
jgi:hypothetical protein